ncbi:MAG: hypothetical protein BWY73_01557 [candidate division TA06 bacterium ADurb.Bin417]|uniref:Uncharacterized protein n=1 Tax=candidate division TA06 bacterium ADurb.Bin417 TaxID=1852828 RepID=A0A1V5M7F8_UNCT6|nr:MAG: hypothetical protein BWY73_01557 [candidate division TA06 bacterium ADurb.Bin417]
MLGLAAIAGSTSNILCMRGLRLVRLPTWAFPSSSRRRASTSLRSRKVSAPPIVRPRLSLRTAVETLIGMRLPSAFMMYPDFPMIGLPVFRVFWSAQLASHMLQRKTSEQRRPTASRRGTPVIFSAARLKEVIRHSLSTVKTPSEMLSRMDSVGCRVVLSIVFIFLRRSCARLSEKLVYPTPGEKGKGRLHLREAGVYSPKDIGVQPSSFMLLLLAFRRAWEAQAKPMAPTERSVTRRPQKTPRRPIRWAPR